MSLAKSGPGGGQGWRAARVQSLYFLATALSASPGGCAIHHYHHFDPAPAGIGTVASTPSDAPAPVAAKPTASESPRGNDSARIMPVNHQAPVEKTVEWRKTEQGPPLPSPRPLKGEKDEVAPATPAGTTLDQAINATLLADPKLRAGFEAINQANADALTASLKPNPTLFTDGQLLPLTRPFTVDRQGGPPQQDVNVSYPIDWFVFGKRAAAMASAALGVRVSEADYADLIRTRVQEVATDFYDVLEAKALLDLARQDVANLERVEASTARAVEAGGKPQVDLSRVRLDLLESRQALREAELSLTTAKAKLRAAMGRLDADPAFDVAGTLDAPLTVESPPADEAFTQALENRPDLRSLRWKLSQANAGITVEERKKYPPVTPQFGYTRQYQEKAIGFPDASSWSAAVTVDLPFFDRNQGNRQKSKSVAAQRLAELRSGEVDLRAEIETIVQELRTARAKTEAAGESQLKLAAEVRDSIAAAYQQGGRTLLEVLDAQRNYRETYRTYISSRATYWRAVYKFYAAVGQQGLPHVEHPR
jgi:cobalt-zinc-cadmium efflux system outer membrane protein